MQLIIAKIIRRNSYFTALYVCLYNLLLASVLTLFSLIANAGSIKAEPCSHSYGNDNSSSLPFTNCTAMIGYQHQIYTLPTMNLFFFFYSPTT